MSRAAVNPGLAPGRRREVVENDDFGAFVRRVVRSYGRRVAAGDVEGLRDLLALATEVETAADNAVEGLRDCGYSWGEIAARIGVSRQAAFKRWGRDRRG